jgi:hypothetical protein
MQTSWSWRRIGNRAMYSASVDAAQTVPSAAMAGGATSGSWVLNV